MSRLMPLTGNFMKKGKATKSYLQNYNYIMILQQHVSLLDWIKIQKIYLSTLVAKCSLKVAKNCRNKQKKIIKKLQKLSN